MGFPARLRAPSLAGPCEDLPDHAHALPTCISDKSARFPSQQRTLLAAFVRWIRLGSVVAVCRLLRSRCSSRFVSDTLPHLSSNVRACMASYLGDPAYEHGSAVTTGALLVNLGTPDAPTSAAI